MTEHGLFQRKHSFGKQKKRCKNVKSKLNLSSSSMPLSQLKLQKAGHSSVKHGRRTQRSQTHMLLRRKVRILRDISSRCIFIDIITTDKMSEHDVRLRLAEEDANSLSRGETLVLHDDISPSILIFQGLQLEELQYVVLFSVEVET